MPTTRKQKAKEKRSRQSDVMSDIENMDGILGSFPEEVFDRQESIEELESEFRWEGLQREISQGENFRSLLNTNTIENSEITAETSRAINSEISSQISKNLDEVRMDQNAINSAIEEKVLPTIQNNTLDPNWANLSAKLDLRSDGLHLSKIGQMAQNGDPQSDGPQQRQNSGMSRKTRVNFLKRILQRLTILKTSQRVQ